MASLRPRSLYGRLVLLLLALLLLLGLVVGASSLATARLYRQEVDQKLNRDLARHLVAETTLLDEGGIRKEGLDHIFHMLMVINPRIEVYLLDREGRILAFSAPSGRVKRERVSLGPVHAFLEPESRLPIYGDDPRHPGRRKVFSAAPIAAGGRTEGYLYVVLGGEELDSVAGRLQTSYILRLGAWGIAASLAVAFLCGLLLLRLLTRRIERLDGRMHRFEEQDFAAAALPDTPPSDGGGDEIDRLEETFDRMARRMVQQMTDLRQLDALRRELVANVSHDLRTPIAALQGYLETLLLKDATVSPEEKREYLAIACKHTEHLGKLVAELFELARLDAGEMRPAIEPFSAAELVQDVVQKFQLAARQREVGLAAELPGELPFVAGDIGLLERVLDNLLENALGHTPEGGRVTVGLCERGPRLELRVEDTGEGIPASELPHIFDRFYRGRNNGERRRRAGAGLGLAISKRILELHGSRLRVDSAPGHGSSFRFELPFARRRETAPGPLR